MRAIRSIESGYYRIALEAVLSDSMHGEITAFELNSVRIADHDGAVGVGYTYTCGRNSAAVAAVLSREIFPICLSARMQTASPIFGTRYGGRNIMAGAAGPASSRYRQSIWPFGISRPFGLASR